MAHSKNTTGQNWPELIFSEFSFLQSSFVYLIIQGSLRILKKGIDLIESWTVLIFGGAGVVFEGCYVFITW